MAELLGDFQYGDVGTYDAGLGNLAGPGLGSYFNDSSGYAVPDSFDYSSPVEPTFAEYGSGYSPSSGVYGNPAHPNTTSWDQFWESDSPLSKIGRAVFGQVANRAIPGAGQALNFMGAKTPGQMSKSMLGTGGGILGTMVGGPLGGLVGGAIGNYVGSKWEGNGQPYSGETSSVGPGAGGFNLEGMVGGLGQLYAASQANNGLRGAGGANEAVQQQIQTLRDMYSPNSPYAQQLRQTLERKDAAAGRRSQYGPREVELMARLADKQAGVSDSMARLATSGQANQLALNNQKNQTRAQQLALLANLGKKSGLMDMFGSGGGGGTSAATPMFNPDYSVGTGFAVPDNYNWSQYDPMFGGG